MRVLTVGTFEIPHWGHARFLNECSTLGELYIGVNTDGFIERYKGHKPVLSYDERIETLKWMGFDNFYANDQPDGSMEELMNQIRPDYLAIGTDWGRKDYLAQIGTTWEYLEDMDIKLVYIPYTQGISTTEIKRRVESRNSNS